MKNGPLQSFFTRLSIITAGLFILASGSNVLALNSSPALFGYNESRQTSVEIFRQLSDVMNRYSQDTIDGEACDNPASNSCSLKKWKELISDLRGKFLLEQVAAINSYVNQMSYRLDNENYEKDDYWATPREFFVKGGDCEDYAIVKFLSLRQLGFSADSLRIVILIDTKLRTPHAVLAVNINDDILILDNQTNEIISHQKISQYVPVYSVNEAGWWMHTSK